MNKSFVFAGFQLYLSLCLGTEKVVFHWDRNFVKNTKTKPNLENRVCLGFPLLTPGFLPLFPWVSSLFSLGFLLIHPGFPPSPPWVPFSPRFSPSPPLVSSFFPLGFFFLSHGFLLRPPGFLLPLGFLPLLLGFPPFSWSKVSPFPCLFTPYLVVVSVFCYLGFALKSPSYSPLSNTTPPPSPYFRVRDFARFEWRQVWVWSGGKTEKLSSWVYPLPVHGHAWILLRYGS